MRRQPASPLVADPQPSRERAAAKMPPFDAVEAGTGSSPALEADWTPEDVATHIADSGVLQRVTLGITDAVRAQAPNPLLHLAAFLRRPVTTASAALSTAVPTTGAVVAPLPPMLRPASPSPVPATDTASAAAPEIGPSLPETMQPTAAAAAAAAVPATSSGALAPKDEEELSRLLREAGIDLSLWGTAGAKSVRHLLAEVEAGECVLRRRGERAEGTTELLRALSRVDVQLHLRGRVLVETHTQMGGRTVQRFKLLSVRLRAGEDWHMAVRRVLRLMLRGLSEHGYLLQEETHTVEKSV